MANKWSSKKFGELLDDKVRNGIYKPKEFHGRGVKIINMGELFANPRLSTSIEMKLLDVNRDEIERFGIQEGDLLFARRSLTAEGAGKCIWIREAHDQAVFESSLIRARVKQNIANSQYLYYYFNSPAGKAGLSSILRQVAVSGITGSDLINLDIPLPLLRIQNQSAEILSAFDDKIELNRQMNRTLEQMAHALFKSWFIDFDPVHAKQRGEQPEGMDADTAALFPNRFVEVDGKEVPEGWEWQPFDTNLVLLGGGTPKTTNEEFWGGTIPWYSVVDVPTEGDIWVIDTQKTITEAGLNSSSTNRE